MDGTLVLTEVACHPSSRPSAPQKPMASASLLDFNKIDLSRTVVSRTELDKYLKQAGRFAMLDGVLHEDVEGRLMVGYKDIAADDWWASDHIPGRPMFPGVLQIEAAAQLSAFDYSAHRVEHAGDGTAPGNFVGFGGVDKARFRGLVEPDCRLILCVHLEKCSRRMFRYQAQAFVDQQMVFEGQILGVLV